MSSEKKILFLSTDATSGGENRWTHEGEGIREQLEKQGAGAAYSFKSKYAVTTKGLLAALLDEKPQILHLTGVGKEDGILFENSTGQVAPVKPHALARLLKEFANCLEWVVLSGCFNHEQAAAISRVIPNGFVIGMDCNMPPSHRIESSSAIYTTLNKSNRSTVEIVRLAKSAVAMETGTDSEIYVYQEGEMLDLLTHQEKSSPQEADVIPVEFSQRVSRVNAYFCNRERQRGEFFQIIEGELSPFSFFALHGTDPQSHHGLFRHFYQRFLVDEWDESASKSYRVVLNQAESLEKYQAEIRARMLEQMKMGKVMLLPDEMEMTEAAKRFASKGIDTVAVEFRVRSSHWKEFTPKLISWFTTEYCQIRKDIDRAPRFYFFLSIIYEHNVDSMVSLDQIRVLVKQLSNCAVLTELQPVGKADILSWVDQHITTNAIRKEKIYHKYFPETRDSYDMTEVELRLDTIINSEASDQSIDYE